MEEKKQLENLTSFLGRGWRFPVRFNQATMGEEGAEMVSDREDIEQSLHILLTTKIGERIMQPPYGCDVSDMLFENLTTGRITYLRDLVETAIIEYEPRIKLYGVTVNTSAYTEGRIDILIDYVIQQTNARHNLVHPFYRPDIPATEADNHVNNKEK